MSAPRVSSQCPPGSVKFSIQQRRNQLLSQLDPTLTYLCLACGFYFGMPVPDMSQDYAFEFASTSPTVRLLVPDGWSAGPRSSGRRIWCAYCWKVVIVPPGPQPLSFQPTLGPGVGSTSHDSSAASHQSSLSAMCRPLPAPMPPCAQNSPVSSTTPSSSSFVFITPTTPATVAFSSSAKTKPKSASPCKAAAPSSRPAVPFVPPPKRPSAAPRPPFLSAPQQGSSFGALNSYQWDVEDKIRLAELAIHQGLPMPEVSAMLGRGIPACEEELENIRSGKSALPRRAAPVGTSPSSGPSAPSPAVQTVVENRWNMTGTEGSGPSGRKRFPDVFFFPS